MSGGKRRGWGEEGTGVREKDRERENFNQAPYSV